MYLYGEKDLDYKKEMNVLMYKLHTFSYCLCSHYLNRKFPIDFQLIYLCFIYDKQVIKLKPT